MEDLAEWAGCTAFALLGLIGIAASANAVDGTVYVAGLLLGGFSVLMIFRLIALHDAKDKS